MPRHEASIKPASSACYRTAVGAIGVGGVYESESADRIGAMARFIADHYADEIHVGGVAAATNLNANDAMTLFRNMCGMTIHDYVLQHRLFHARRLLATTDRKLL